MKQLLLASSEMLNLLFPHGPCSTRKACHVAGRVVLSLHPRAALPELWPWSTVRGLALWNVRSLVDCS